MEREALRTLEDLDANGPYGDWADEFRFGLLLATGQHLDAAQPLQLPSSLAVEVRRQRIASWLRSMKPLAAIDGEWSRPTLPKPVLQSTGGAQSEEPDEDAWTCRERTLQVCDDYLAERFLDALRTVETLTMAAPLYPAGWGLEGAVLAKLGKLERAETAFSKAIELCPSYAPARLSRAKVRYMRWRFRSATVDAQQVIRQEPLRLSAHQIALKALLLTGCWRAALRVWRESSPAVEHALSVQDLAESLAAQSVDTERPLFQF